MTISRPQARLERFDTRKLFVFISTVTAVCLMQLALSIWRTRHSYFILDDFLNFIIYRDMGVTWRYAFRDLFGHVTPLYRMVQAAFFAINGLHFAAARAIILGVALIPTTMLMLVGRRLDVPLPVSASGALLIGCLPQFGQAELWWSNALLVVPGFAAVLTCLWFLVGPHGNGQRKTDAVLAALVFAVGLGFYDKTLFAVVLFFVTLVFLRLPDRPILAACLGALFDLRFVLVIAMAWSVALLFLREGSPAPPDLWIALKFMWIAWSDAALETLFGMGSSGVQFPSPMLAPLLSHFLLLTAMSYTLWRSGWRAAPIWVGVLVYIGATLILTARLRAGPFGAEFGRTLRYAVEPAAFIVAATVIALSKLPLRESWYPASVLTTLAVFVSVQVDIPAIGDPAGTRQFVANLRHSIVQTQGAAGMVILDAPLPETIMASWMAPLNVPSRFLPLITTDKFSYGNGPAATWMLDPAGNLRQIH
jgi:hypothetical protein